MKYRLRSQDNRIFKYWFTASNTRPSCFVDNVSNHHLREQMVKECRLWTIQVLETILKQSWTTSWLYMENNLNIWYEVKHINVIQPLYIKCTLPIYIYKLNNSFGHNFVLSGQKVVLLCHFSSLTATYKMMFHKHIRDILNFFSNPISQTLKLKIS